jgi:hypothetical protein
MIYDVWYMIFDVWCRLVYDEQCLMFDIWYVMNYVIYVVNKYDLLYDVGFTIYDVWRKCEVWWNIISTLYIDKSTARFQNVFCILYM